MSDNKKDYTGTIQNLLYCYPLYNYINKEKVNVLVFGYSGITENLLTLLLKWLKSAAIN